MPLLIINQIFDDCPFQRNQKTIAQKVLVQPFTKWANILAEAQSLVVNHKEDYDFDFGKLNHSMSRKFR